MLAPTDQASLLAHWYQALVRYCNLDPSTFQLAQGGISVGFTSEFLWEILDAVPPRALNHVYNPSQGNRFSSNYGAVIGNLTDRGNDVLQEALDMWASAGGFPSTKAYGCTIRQLDYAILSTPSVEFSVDCSAGTPDLAGTWAAGHLAVGREIVDVAQGAAPVPVTITARFDHLATITAGPLDRISDNPELRDYAPWFLSPTMAMAYYEKDGWGAYPTWQTTFGDAGNMLRRTTGLVVADGMCVTVTTGPASGRAAPRPSADDVASLLFQPVTVASSRSPMGHTRLVATRPDDGTVTTCSPAGNPIVLGVNVLSAPAYITS